MKKVIIPKGLLPVVTPPHGVNGWTPPFLNQSGCGSRLSTPTVSPCSVILHVQPDHFPEPGKMMP